MYFLDKTPRYHLIIDEIITVFPQAKFILLWRNPLSVVSSIMSTWAEGRWNLHHYRVDIYAGVENLINAAVKYEDKMFTMRYEDLTKNCTEKLEECCQYLDLQADSIDPGKLNSVELGQQFGDQIGVRKYQDVSVDSLDIWMTLLSILE